VHVTAMPATEPETGWLVQSILAVGALQTATPRARLHARSVLSEWRLYDLTDTVELVVSELVTNAVTASTDAKGRPRYADGRGLPIIHVRLASDGATVLVEVWDENTRAPVLLSSGADDESGRGLMLVDALSERWGWEPAGRGKVVWALIGVA
jgi:anti-sigma regulatory factor (Ser/Thr protein kinase)